MDVASTTSAQVGQATPQARETLSSDFEAFLTLLTAQIQNQDPLNPVDSEDFATQLATFSSVEQQVKTNDLLADLGAKLVTSSLGEMAGWVGRKARMVAPGHFEGAPIEVLPTIPSFADKAELVVFDTTGAEVQRLALPLDEPSVEWAGVDEDGAPFPEGDYEFVVVSSQNGEIITENFAELFLPVEEVRSVNGEVFVAVAGGALYPAGLVSGLK